MMAMHGEEGDPPGGVEVLPALCGHQPPCWYGRRNSGAQKTEGRLDYYDEADPQRGQDDDGVDRCGKDVPEDDSSIGRPRTRARATKSCSLV